MIIDTLDNLYKYSTLNPLFSTAFEFISSHDLHKLAIGKSELQGKDLMLTIAQSAPKTKEEAKLETHREYIDIQIPLSGIEIMGYSAAKYCKTVATPYNEKNDISFFDDKVETYLTVRPGMFVIFFPEDAHAPAITTVDLKKVIIKVKA